MHPPSPAGVGFSYCDYANCTASDTSTAVDNHNVLKAFFKGFPEFAKNDFYITGESYAGVYCPTLAEQVMNDATNKINLKGLAVGNGCWGSKVRAVFLRCVSPRES
jgi:cathepsin A (carboxypeptidase C)